jgi:hypothetical protein
MKYNYIIFIFTLLVIIIILFNSFTKNSIFGFQNYYQNYIPWSTDLIKRFNIYQSTMKKNIIQFNLEQLQKQASPEEAELYLKTGYWYWPEDLKQLYIDKIWQNPIIKIEPQYVLNYAMSIYNQNAIRQLLAWNTKEGKFLLYGGDLGVSDGMPKDIHNTIKCSTDSNNNSFMEKKVYRGFNLWNGYLNMTKSVVKPEDIPKEMPGFSFIKSPCNPCNVFNNPADFSCPFYLNIKGDKSVSLPWKQLWNL